MQTQGFQNTNNFLLPQGMQIGIIPVTVSPIDSGITVGMGTNATNPKFVGFVPMSLLIDASKLTSGGITLKIGYVDFEIYAPAGTKYSYNIPAFPDGIFTFDFDAASAGSVNIYFQNFPVTPQSYLNSNATVQQQVVNPPNQSLNVSVTNATVKVNADFSANAVSMAALSLSNVASGNYANSTSLKFILTGASLAAAGNVSINFSVNGNAISIPVYLTTTPQNLTLEIFEKDFAASTISNLSLSAALATGNCVAIIVME